MELCTAFVLMFSTLDTTGCQSRDINVMWQPFNKCFHRPLILLCNLVSNYPRFLSPFVAQRSTYISRSNHVFRVFPTQSYALNWKRGLLRLAPVYLTLFP